MGTVPAQLQRNSPRRTRWRLVKKLPRTVADTVDGVTDMVLPSLNEAAAPPWVLSRLRYQQPTGT